MKVCMKHQGGSFIFWLDQYLKRFSIWKIAGRQSLIWWVFIYQNIDSIRVLTGFELFDPYSLSMTTETWPVLLSNYLIQVNYSLLTINLIKRSSPLKTFFSGKLLISNQQKTDHRFKSWNSGLSLEKIYFWISLTLSVLFCYSIISLCSLSASIPLLFLTGCNTQIRTMAFLFLFGKHRGEEYDFMDSSTVELWKLQLTVEAPNREEHIQDIYDSTDFHASFLC